MKIIPLKKRIESFENAIERHFPYGVSNELKRYIAINFIWEKLIHKTRLTDYMQYEYFRYSSRTRREFISEQRRLIIDEVFNTKEGDQIFNEKNFFNEKFDEFINRDWLDVENATYSDFLEFVSKHPRFFGKPQAGSLGRGAGMFDVNTIDNKKNFFEELKQRKMLLEELIHQHKDLAEFNDTSVNTLRVVTVLRPNGEVVILTGDLRLGRKGKTSDNFHNRGIAALFDVENGIIYTSGIDKTNQRYIIHPDSGKQIIGFRIPVWDKVKETVSKAAHVVPEVHYVGWDIAIGESGEVYIVEGNCCADPDVTQMPDGIGKWPMFIPLLEEAKKSKIK